MAAPDIARLIQLAMELERSAGVPLDPYDDRLPGAAPCAPGILAVPGQKDVMRARQADDALQAAGQRRRIAEMERKRKADLSAIHAQAKVQGVDDDTRRAMIVRISEGRTNTSADLTAPERAALLRELGGSRKSRRAGRGPSPAAMDHQTMLKRVEQLLTVLRLPWSYAEAILRRQRGILDKSVTCPTQQANPTELRAVIAALDARRRKLAVAS